MLCLPVLRFQPVPIYAMYNCESSCLECVTYDDAVIEVHVQGQYFALYSHFTTLCQTPQTGNSTARCMVNAVSILNFNRALALSRGHMQGQQT